MSVVTLKSRLRKAELRSRGGRGRSMFLVWGRTDDGLRRALAPFRERIGEGLLVGALWPYPEEPAAPRWTLERDVSDRELEALIEQLQAFEGEDNAPPEGLPRDVRKWSDADLLNVALTSRAFQVPAA